MSVVQHAREGGFFKLRGHILSLEKIDVGNAIPSDCFDDAGKTAYRRGGGGGGEAPLGHHLPMGTTDR